MGGLAKFSRTTNNNKGELTGGLGIGGLSCIRLANRKAAEGKPLSLKIMLAVFMLCMHRNEMIRSESRSPVCQDARYAMDPFEMSAYHAALGSTMGASVASTLIWGSTVIQSVFSICSTQHDCQPRTVRICSADPCMLLLHSSPSRRRRCSPWHVIRVPRWGWKASLHGSNLRRRVGTEDCRNDLSVRSRMICWVLACASPWD